LYQKEYSPYNLINIVKDDILEKRQIIVMSDLHVPFHSIGAVELTLQIAKDINVDEIILNGDICDMHGFSAHEPNIDVKESVSEEINAIIYFLLELRDRFPKTKRTFLLGNHGHRLNRYIKRNCPELYGFIDIQDLLFLKDYNYGFIPYTADQKYIITPNLIVRHEPINGGMHFAHSTNVKSGVSSIVGHTHRQQYSTLHTLNGKKVSCWGTGWLGDKNHPAFNYVKTHHSWDLGFCLVTIIENQFFVNQIEIQEICGTFSCIVNGNYYEL
jgi:hypothetical protein